MALADYIETKPVIDTGRLRLRPFQKEDVPALKGWLLDPSIYRYWGKGPSVTDKDPELLFKSEKKTKSFHLGIEEKSSGKVIGDLWVYLIQQDRMADVALRIAPICQRKGYGTEALLAMTRFCFEHTQLKRLQAEIDIRNIASSRIFEKCGYRKEGMIRQGRMVNSWCDYYIYGILDTDEIG